MHGLGNDYIYVNLFAESVADPPALARAMAARHTGVGSDGLILVGPSQAADVRMAMFNADGSRGAMCGNGLRCVARFAIDNGLAGRPGPSGSQEESARLLEDHLSGLDPSPAVGQVVTVETDAGVLAAAVLSGRGGEGLVCADVGRPGLDPSTIPTTLPGPQVVETPIVVAGRHLSVTCISMGSAHAVIFVEQLDTIDVPALGPQLERHAAFPDRINAHFVQVLDATRVVARTWERGSGITQACGTGASAICVAGVLTGRTERRIEVQMPGGALAIHWGVNERVYMTGPAVSVFTGQWAVPVP
jgi:diaminopimelate epimerase